MVNDSPNSPASDIVTSTEVNVARFAALGQVALYRKHFKAYTDHVDNCGDFLILLFQDLEAKPEDWYLFNISTCWIFYHFTSAKPFSRQQ